MKVLFQILMFVLSTQTTFAEWEYIGNINSPYEVEKNTIKFPCENAVVKLEVCTNDILRIRMSPDGNFAPNEPWVVIQYDWTEVPYKIRDEADHVHIQTQSLTIKVYKTPFRIDIWDEDGALRYSQAEESMGWDGEKVISKNIMNESDHYFGLGQRYEESDLRGKKTDLWLTENVTPVPFFMSTAGYGIFFHNTWKTSFDFTGNPYTFSAPGGGELDYYFMIGPEFKHILNSYTKITGKSPMPPKWALGFYFSKWGAYQNGQPGILKDVREARNEKDWPLDVVRVHSLACGQGIWASPSLEWEVSEWGPFPAVDDMISDLHEMNMHPIFWENPGIPVECAELYADAEYSDAYLMQNGKPWVGKFGYGLGTGSLIDFTNPQAVEWWGDLHHFLIDADADGMAGDHGEEVFGDMYSPHSNMYGDELHNLYSFLYDRATWEAFKLKNPNKRTIVFGRSLFAGTQRYPMQGTQDSMEEGKNIIGEMMSHINFGLSGVPFRTFTDNVTREYVWDGTYSAVNRFSQFLCLGSGGERTGVIWSGNESADMNYRKYARLRYRLMPYIYSYVWETSQTGSPLMRAMVLEYQEDPNSYKAYGQYLLGKELLIAPLWSDTVFHRTIYLPEGEWIDFFDETVYQGNQDIQYHAPIDRVPILVKAGSIIPMAADGQHFMDENTSELTIHVYPKGSSHFKLYEDDGISYDYENDVNALTLFTSKQKKDELLIKKYKPRGAYQIPERDHVFCIHKIDAVDELTINDKTYQKVQTKKEYDTKPACWYYENSTEKIWIKIQGGADQEILISLANNKQ